MKLKMMALALGLMLGLVWAGCALADTAQSQIVGIVQKVKGQTLVKRSGRSMAADPGLKLKQGDTIITGEASSMGVLFRDDSMLSIGPVSEIVIDQFIFAPTENRLGMVTRMLKGTAAFLTGRIAEKAPGKVKVETPLATIGVRGTHFLVYVDPESGKAKAAEGGK